MGRTTGQRTTVGSDEPITRKRNAWRVKSARLASGLPHTTCCHTFRAAGITTYLRHGGAIEHAQQIANHPRAP